jgi:hypothetical protein
MFSFKAFKKEAAKAPSSGRKKSSKNADVTILFLFINFMC